MANTYLTKTACFCICENLLWLLIELLWESVESFDVLLDFLLVHWSGNFFHGSPDIEDLIKNQIFSSKVIYQFTQDLDIKSASVTSNIL